LKGTVLPNTFNYASSSEDFDGDGVLKPTLVSILHSNFTNLCGNSSFGVYCNPTSLVLESVPNSDVIKATLSTD